MRKTPKLSTGSRRALLQGKPGGLPVHTGIDALLVGLAAMWISAILVAPLVEGRAIYTFFSVICHQLPVRSWFLAGDPLAACIRCTSIYAGFLCALVLRIPPMRWFLRVSIAVLVLEVTAARLWIDIELARTVSGLLLGLASAGFVSEGIRELISRRRAGHRRFSRTSQTGDVLEHV